MTPSILHTEPTYEPLGLNWETAWIITQSDLALFQKRVNVPFQIAQASLSQHFEPLAAAHCDQNLGIKCCCILIGIAEHFKILQAICCTIITCNKSQVQTCQKVRTCTNTGGHCTARMDRILLLYLYSIAVQRFGLSAFCFAAKVCIKSCMDLLSCCAWGFWKGKEILVSAMLKVKFAPADVTCA